MRKMPDFIGDFMLLDDKEQQRVRQEGAGLTLSEYNHLAESGYGIFFMFIETRQQVGNLEKITGTIMDNEEFRVAKFDGELDAESIRFTKRYTPKTREKFALLHRGSLSEEIPYEGKIRKDGSFRGTYHMNGEVKWDGQFTLERYFDPSMN